MKRYCTLCSSDKALHWQERRRGRGAYPQEGKKGADIKCKSNGRDQEGHAALLPTFFDQESVTLARVTKGKKDVSIPTGRREGSLIQ